MRKIEKLSYFKALPPYLGGKRKLLPWIFGHLKRVVPDSQWPDLTFADAFVGGGSISLFAKLNGFRQVLANDWSSRSQLVIQGLLQNQSVTLSREDVLRLIQIQLDTPGLIEQILCPSVFSSRHAKALDQLRVGIEQFSCPVKQALGRLLLWHLVTDYVAFGTSIGTSNRPFAEVLDGVRDWQSLNPKRFMDGSFEKLLQPTWKNLESLRKRINQGACGGSPVQGFQMDATEFIDSIQANILYLDPPYAGTTGYESSNRVLDTVLFGEPESVGSSFSTGVGALNGLLESARHIPIWVLSYGNQCLPLEELVALVQRQVPNRDVQGFSRHYKHLAHVSKNKLNQELLVIATERGV